MESKILLISANRWNFTDDQTNETRKGTTCYVVHLNTSDDNADNIGNKPKKYTLPYDFFDKLQKLTLPVQATGLLEYNFNRDKIELIDIDNVEAL